MRNSDVDELSIGELADRFGLATHVLRHWEDVGVLIPARRQAGRRRYFTDQVADVAMILLGRDCGLSLGQLRRLMTVASRDEQRAILLDHVALLQRRVAAAQTALDLVGHALTCDADDVTRCPDFRRKLDGYGAGPRCT
ncbi:helix-turn-helix domain-containing protein [Phytoactinopolyspora halotolerans]|uniref:MerR family transcriptional regulator n=1 Tax=Phytoactinopolyspora halotolerans TaxID=1981512 RepID=A0A6L9SD11_9ACTN|nr:MerR family transcriptional regulator [Phytoactinopolyspora halotolerans]NEE02983.1 MerR family transcriptional regulator [Phytoactinopolyspora halotolerans]